MSFNEVSSTHLILALQSFRTVTKHVRLITLYLELEQNGLARVDAREDLSSIETSSFILLASCALGNASR
jgi:hypothetical protein